MGVAVRRNKAPIFLNGFTRGGSTLVLNLLLSHPGVCAPSGETQMVFLGGTGYEPRWRGHYKRWRYDLPLSLTGHPRLFDPENLTPRPQLPAWAMRHVDRVLYRERFAARSTVHNRFISEDVAYTTEQLRQARLLCKNLNGVVLMTDNFSAIYPDGTFFGLVRNGFALCEGNLRRGRSPKDFARQYRQLVETMLEHAATMERYRIIRFEDILRDPLGETEAMYRHAGLDFGAVDKIRLRLKPTAPRAGEKQAAPTSRGRIGWYPKQELPAQVRPDIDEIQQDRLAAGDRDSFLEIAGPTMERLGYL